MAGKLLDEIEQKETGSFRKAKARLVILGYEDPLIDSLPRDSPTLGGDSRMLALQRIASHKWTARSFDIRTVPPGQSSRLPYPRHRTTTVVEIEDETTRQ